MSRFNQFWETWRAEKPHYQTLRQWWDVGKVQIKMFCQQYASHSTRMFKRKIQALEQEILLVISQASGNGASDLAEILSQNKLQLRNLLEERGQGALVRARYMQFKDMDASTTFFFGLERRPAEMKQRLQCLKLPSGRETSDPKEIRSSALSFYEDLYRAEQCDWAVGNELLHDVPCLGEEEALGLERPLSYNELTDAMQQQTPSRSPGLDGLSGEVYKGVLSLLGPDLHAVFQECVREGSLPLSCRRAVLALLP